MNRVYVNYHLLEEVKCGMWSDTKDRKKQLKLAVNLLSDQMSLGNAMMKVVREWRQSCLNSLTDDFLNKRAWIGQAACAYKHNIPEDITRKAWGEINKNERTLANKQADRAIEYWYYHNNYKSKTLRGSVGEQMLLGRYTRLY